VPDTPAARRLWATFTSYLVFSRAAYVVSPRSPTVASHTALAHIAEALFMVCESKFMGGEGPRGAASVIMLNAGLYLVAAVDAVRRTCTKEWTKSADPGRSQAADRAALVTARADAGTSTTDAMERAALEKASLEAALAEAKSSASEAAKRAAAEKGSLEASLAEAAKREAAEKTVLEQALAQARKAAVDAEEMAAAGKTAADNALAEKAAAEAALSDARKSAAEAAGKAAAEIAAVEAELADAKKSAAEAVETAVAEKAAAEHALAEARKLAAEAAEKAAEKATESATAEKATVEQAAPEKEAAETTSSESAAVVKADAKGKTKNHEQELEDACRTIFALCDPEGERSITVKVFADTCQKYEYIADFCSIKKIEGKADAQHIYLVLGPPTQRLDYDSFKRGVVSVRGEGGATTIMNEEHKLATIYNTIDVDGGGTVSMHELSAFCIKHPKVADLVGIGRKQRSGEGGKSLKRMSTDGLFNKMAKGSTTLTRKQFFEYVREHGAGME